MREVCLTETFVVSVANAMVGQEFIGDGQRTGRLLVTAFRADWAAIEIVLVPEIRERHGE